MNKYSFNELPSKFPIWQNVDGVMVSNLKKNEWFDKVIDDNTYTETVSEYSLSKPNGNANCPPPPNRPIPPIAPPPPNRPIPPIAPPENEIKNEKKLATEILLNYDQFLAYIDRAITLSQGQVVRYLKNVRRKGMLSKEQMEVVAMELGVGSLVNPRDRIRPVQNYKQAVRFAKDAIEKIQDDVIELMHIVLISKIDARLLLIHITNQSIIKDLDRVM